MNRDKDNVWRVTQGLEPLKPMEDIVKEFQEYVGTYHKQAGYENYSDELFMDDILYGLGSSLNIDYKWLQGYIKFKQRLIRHLMKDEVALAEIKLALKEHETI